MPSELCLAFSGDICRCEVKVDATRVALAEECSQCCLGGVIWWTDDGVDAIIADINEVVDFICSNDYEWEVSRIEVRDFLKQERHGIACRIEALNDLYDCPVIEDKRILGACSNHFVGSVLQDFANILFLEYSWLSCCIITLKLIGLHVEFTTHNQAIVVLEIRALVNGLLLLVLDCWMVDIKWEQQ